MNESEKCAKHGEVPVWLVCRHVGEGSADTVIFSENQDALCFECAQDFKNLTHLDVVGICEECLKDFTANLMVTTQTFANLKNRVVGIEYLKGKWTKDDKESSG
ncbi:MAG: protein-arginine kinase activator protein McsA [Desulforhopalus sp.]|jgi:protein-arginine kinase activator protein McsA